MGDDSLEVLDLRGHTLVLIALAMCLDIFCVSLCRSVCVVFRRLGRLMRDESDLTVMRPRDRRAAAILNGAGRRFC